MTEEHRLFICKLAMQAERAYQNFYAISLRNSVGRSLEESEKAAAEYCVAEAEFYEARRNLRQAVESFK